MPIRTDETLVAAIVEVDPSVDLSPFIAAASSLVDSIPGLDDDRLAIIETWLAAHFYCMKEPRSVNETAGSVSVTYQSKIDFNLKLSHYGQTAAVLDTSGTLKGLSGTHIGATWLGTVPVNSIC